jgi:hypothetical protein
MQLLFEEWSSYNDVVPYQSAEDFDGIDLVSKLHSLPNSLCSCWKLPMQHLQQTGTAAAVGLIVSLELDTSLYFGISRTLDCAMTANASPPRP